MASTIELEATSRQSVGKGAARQARRAGQVPGVVYGDNQDPVAINVHQPALLKVLRAGKFLSTLISITIDGKAETVICRGVQRHVVKDLPIHVDFLRLSKTSRISMMIPVEFINDSEAPGLTKGGVLTIVRNEIELRVLASNIPVAIEVDLTGLEIGDGIRINDVTLPEGATPTILDRDFMIANISAPTVLAAGDEDEEGVEGEVEEGDEEAAETEASDE